MLVVRNEMNIYILQFGTLTCSGTKLETLKVGCNLFVRKLHSLNK